MTTASNLAPVPPASAGQIDIAATAEAVRNLRTELNVLFPERESLITQVIYAILTRHHVLVFGRTGTGKSRLVSRLFGAFVGAKLFAIELSKFKSEADVFGIANPKRMREEGVVWHNAKGTILEANFADLDEIFDANDHLLRAILGVLNERRFHNGDQMETVSLHSAMASTNADPKDEIRRSKTLTAVVDRFLFQTRVSYLEQDENRRRMFEAFLADRRVTTQLTYAQISALADAVRDVPIADPALIELHNQILLGARKLRDRDEMEISDRRACEALRVVQANAVLYGRTAVVPEDFLATQWVYCFGDEAADLERFRDMAKPLVEKVVKDRQPDIIATQMKLLDQLQARLPQVDKKSKLPAEELVQLRRALVLLQGEVENVKPAHAAVEDRRKAMLASITAAKATVGELIDKE
jgi:MoxR-like ATPase